MAKGLMDEIGFGKYKESLVIDVIKNNTDYMVWLITQTGFELDNEAYAVYRTECEGKGLEP